VNGFVRYSAVKKNGFAANKINFQQEKWYSGNTRGFKPGLLTQAAVFPHLQADLETLDSSEYPCT
jgi:hypothetical protein